MQISTLSSHKISPPANSLGKSLFKIQNSVFKKNKISQTHLRGGRPVNQPENPSIQAMDSGHHKSENPSTKSANPETITLSLSLYMKSQNPDGTQRCCTAVVELFVSTAVEFDFAAAGVRFFHRPALKLQKQRGKE